jgi:hypothetical protein
MFSDESCSAFAGSGGGLDTFAGLTGQSLPYGSTNLIDMDCYSCKEPQENNNDGNDGDDADEVAEGYETVYSGAGKCEATMDSSVNPYPNTNACNYIPGTKIVRRTELSSLLAPRLTRLPLTLLVSLLFRLASSLLASTTSRPSSTEPPSTFRSKEIVASESDR